MPNEPFGISIVEAMSAGLIPITPNIGGEAECSFKLPIPINRTCNRNNCENNKK